MERQKVTKENHYFLRDLETLPVDALKNLQFKKTKQTLERAYHKSDFYRQRFDEARVKPDDFKTLEDIARFPFIDKQDLIKDQEANPPFGSRVCVGPPKIRRVNLTSGTSGMGQEVHCHEEESIYAANASTACHFAAIGLKPGDLSAVLYPLGTMTGGMLSYEALRVFGTTPLADYFALVEVLDKDTDQPVAHGEWGEPVVTTFSRQAMPLVRFRSNDRVRRLPPDLCDCGRTSSALWEVGTISRYDDMIKIKATNVWPQIVDEAVFSFDEVEEYNGRVFIDANGQEVARVSLEFKKIALDDSAKAAVLRRQGAKIKEMTQVSMALAAVPYGTLPLFEYKVRRRSDERIEGLERIKYIEKE